MRLTMSTTLYAPGMLRGERLLQICIGASIVVHALAMLYAPKVEPPPAPPKQIKATLRAAPSAPAAPKPEAPKPEVAPEPPVPPPPPPPVAGAKPLPTPAAKPVPEKAVTKSTTPPPVAAAEPAPAVPAPAAAPAPSSEPRTAAPAADATKAAPSAGNADVSDKALVDGYQAQLAQVAAKFKRYPNEAMQNQWEGIATVRLKIGTDGKIAGVEITTSSGHAMLDEQASITINKAKPFVQIPAGLRGKEFLATVRVVYSLKN